ncbi:HIT family hydrolase [Caloranaerobacter sp. TR13]|uniref:HIT family protein n=1 Tax=Caloranaerobacter sp. TR13 TaxID=1302151 RepID=UPI0006D45926|nr:HIT family hydrolase [Caloranaerobacter sp. TR13]
MESCIFCKIVQGEIKANIVYEDELVVVFLDIDPINKGHLLIVPRKHKLDLDELSIEESSRVMEISKLMVRILKKQFNPDGYSIMQNGGEFNDIGHYHLHAIPRYKNDGFEWTFGKVEDHDLSEIGKELIKEISNTK